MEIHETLTAALAAVTSVYGTDLVLTIGDPPMIRLDGQIRPVANVAPIDNALMDVYLRSLLSEDQRHELEHDRDADFAFSWNDFRFRGNAFYQRGVPAISLRNIQNSIPTCDQIGLPPAVQQLIHDKQGLVLFCGPTGSGKSTSMASLVDAINVAKPCHIITIEDPIEYLHENRVAIVHQREVGIDALSFGRALRAALREDPDVVLVGEMRDPESISITLTLAETGHLVLSSLHTNDAPQTLDRIVDVFPPAQQGQIRMQLASVLTAVVAQRLVPREGGGLIAVYEVLLGTSAACNLIRDGKTNQLRNVMQIGISQGHQTLEMGLNSLQRSGVISHQTAIETAFVPHEIEGAILTSPLLASQPN